jgi:hypothetical protein
MMPELTLAIVGLAVGLAATGGYLLGLWRFESRRRDELLTATRDAETERDGAVAAAALAARELADARGAAEREAAEREALRATRPPRDAADGAPAAPAVPLITHTVLLDGVSNSGKSTLVHRLAFPCTDLEQLRRLPATQLPYRTRQMPLCFDVAPAEAIEPEAGAETAAVGARPAAGGAPGQLVLHAQVLQDIAGEKDGDIVDVLESLAAERARMLGPERPGAVVVLVVWDMANPEASRDALTKSRLKAAYVNRHGRAMIRSVLVFFNKLDLLTVAPERLRRLVDDERAHVESVLRAVFGDTVARTYLHGSALRGDGVIECQGAIYAALGLAAHFREDGIAIKKP